jgi:23S rRNA (adenine2030-N6)-methyltransferase
MLSYRHAFHAGNHADVLKHFTLIQLLRHLAQKPKPFWYIDTHAGAGWYDLDGHYAQTNAEYESGISRLWARDDLPSALSDYVKLVRDMNPPGALRRYPGSPQIALQFTRTEDKLRLFEMHSTEIELLARNMASASPRVMAVGGDGFSCLASVLPPPTRRGLILLDPSYEDKQDYRHVIVALKEGLRRFATGVFAIWYPQVQRAESRNLPDQLKRHCPGDWLHVALTVKSPAPGGLGLHGSGMFIVNPPFSLPQPLQQVMPYLVRVLKQDPAARFDLEYKID